MKKIGWGAWTRTTTGGSKVRCPAIRRRPKATPIFRGPPGGCQCRLIYVEDEVWLRLAEPFPEEEVHWRVETLSRDKRRALVVPYIDARAVLDRLDEVVGPENWHDTYELLARDEEAFYVKCRLTVLGVTKEDAGEGESLKAAFSDALKRAAVKFGIGRHLYRMEKAWVDYDEKTGRFTPPGGAAQKPEAHELIDRLLERLRAEGKGREAAKILTKYGGYGKTPEETKKLYGELRALLRG